MADIRMKMIGNYLKDAAKCLERDRKNGMPFEEVKVKYAEVLAFLDEIERIANDDSAGRTRLRRIK